MIGRCGSSGGSSALMRISRVARQMGVYVYKFGRNDFERRAAQEHRQAKPALASLTSSGFERGGS